MSDKIIIAEFMGAIPVFNNDGTVWDEAVHLNETIYLTEKPTDVSFMPYLCYDTDWNWIIPVCQKIKEVKSDDTWINLCIAWPSMTLMQMDISITYKAVVNFIKLYNLQPQSHAPSPIQGLNEIRK